MTRPSDHDVLGFGLLNSGIWQLVELASLQNKVVVSLSGKSHFAPIANMCFILVRETEHRQMFKRSQSVQVKRKHSQVLAHPQGTPNTICHP